MLVAWRRSHETITVTDQNEQHHERRQFTYIFRWDRHGRKDQPCVVLARGAMNSCLVKFEDGYTMVTSRNALQRHHEHSNSSAETIPAR